MKSRFIWIPAVVLTLTLFGQVAAYRFQRPTFTTHASWAFRPRSFAEARDKAEVIVVAEVLRVSRGEDLVTQARGEPNDEDRIPTQRVLLRVLRGYRGAEEGAMLTLHQTGGAVQPPAPKEGDKDPQTTVPQIILEGDPLYKAGQRFLLLLDTGRQEQVMTISPEGRYRLSSTNTLIPMVRNKTTAEVSGKTVDEVARAFFQ